MLATLSRYSTAHAGLDAASAATRPVTTNTSARPSAVIEPPGRNGECSRNYPIPGGNARGNAPAEPTRTLSRSGVEVFAGRGRGRAHPVPLLAQQELVEPDRAAFE